MTFIKQFPITVVSCFCKKKKKGYTYPPPKNTNTDKVSELVNSVEHLVAKESVIFLRK